MIEGVDNQQVSVPCKMTTIWWENAAMGSNLMVNYVKYFDVEAPIFGVGMERHEKVTII